MSNAIFQIKWNKPDFNPWQHHISSKSKLNQWKQKNYIHQSSLEISQSSLQRINKHNRNLNLVQYSISIHDLIKRWRKFNPCGIKDNIKKHHISIRNKKYHWSLKLSKYPATENTMKEKIKALHNSYTKFQIRNNQLIKTQKPQNPQKNKYILMMTE